MASIYPSHTAPPHEVVFWIHTPVRRGSGPGSFLWSAAPHSLENRLSRRLSSSRSASFWQDVRHGSWLSHSVGTSDRSRAAQPGGTIGGHSWGRRSLLQARRPLTPPYARVHGPCRGPRPVPYPRLFLDPYLLLLTVDLLSQPVQPAGYLVQLKAEALRLFAQTAQLVLLIGTLGR